MLPVMRSADRTLPAKCFAPPLRRFFLLAACVLALSCQAGICQDFSAVVPAFTQKYCIQCHDGQEAEADIAFSNFRTEQDMQANRKTWESVLKMLDMGVMPPEGQPQPTKRERQAIVAWLRATLTQVDCTLPGDPGRVTVRRLNRTEYDNTIRDLIGIDLKLARDFPSDDVGEGFDNIGDVLSLSPLLFEKYMDAAERIAQAAILVSDPNQASKQHREGKDLQTKGGRLDEYGVHHLYSSGNVFGEFNFPRDGDYRIRVQAGADQAGPEIAKMEVSIGNKLAKAVYVRAPSDRLNVHEINVTAFRGKQQVAAAFVNDYYMPDASNPNERDRNLYIKSIEVAGPLDVNPDQIPASHNQIVTARPNKRTSVREAAEQVLQPLLLRAFRRPATTAEVEAHAQLVEFAVEKGDTYERGIQVALSAVLVSPHFLYRVERDPDPHDPMAKHGLNDFELATRLSYFLWSSMPDDELFALAKRGELSRDAVLRRQVPRMLADPKAIALAENFGQQWLNLRNLEVVAPDPNAFPTFTAQLRQDMMQETQLFFLSIMQNNRSILDFVDGEYSFVNGRLAEHYGIEGVRGDEFQRVSLENTPRAGVLTQASILTLTSDPMRTSPVKRGKWVMENLLGTPPPDPPADVPEFAETQAAAPNLSLRQQFELHRSNPTCASCHRHMDPLGFGLENFDAIGRWRERDGKFSIDAAGSLPSGDSFNGPKQLTKILSKRHEQFGRFLTQKMLTYALGRGLELYDQCHVDGIVAELQEGDYRFSTLVTGIITSEPFRLRRGEGGER